MDGQGVTNCLDIIRSKLDLARAFCGSRDLQHVEKILLPVTL
jgi:isopentenyl diphosphate isomerase/L-lactate dehydrogenase-like FMN-dependent dehydrogenase